MLTTATLLRRMRKCKVSAQRLNPKRPMPRHITVKLPEVKDKERILKAARESKFVMYKVIPIIVLVDFSTETLQDRRKWHNIQNVERKNFQSRILFLAKLSFRTEGEIKRFPKKQKQRGFIDIRLALQEL